MATLGATPSTTEYTTPAEALLLLPFFTANSLKPSTTVKEELYTYPTPDTSFLNGGATNLSMSRSRFVPPATNPSTAVWSWSGASLQDKGLFIMTGMRPDATGMGIWLGDTVPSTNEIPDKGWLFNAEQSTTQFNMYKKTGGAFTSLGTEVKIGPVAAGKNDGATFGMAIFWDNVANQLVGLLRIGAGMWFPILNITDTSLTTVRYGGVRATSTGVGQVMFSYVPMGFYLGA